MSTPSMARSRSPMRREKSRKASNARALSNRQLGRLTVHDGVLLPPHGGKRVQSHGVARHQGIEEMPK